MTKRTRTGLLMGFVMLLAASLAVWAQASKDGVITINGGRTTVLMRAPSPNITPAVPPDAGLVTIYSDLGTGNNVYNAAVGTGVLGRQVPGQPRPEWLANGFTPTADHTVTEIQVGVTYSQGTNDVIMTLNEDAGGIPGTVLHTWKFSNLPTFGTCCTLQTGKLKTGIPLTKGTLYWVVLRTAGDGQDTWDVWNNNFNNLQGPFSNNTGQGWNKESTQTLGAFGVFGQ